MTQRNSRTKTTLSSEKGKREKSEKDILHALSFAMSWLKKTNDGFFLEKKRNEQIISEAICSEVGERVLKSGSVQLRAKNSNIFILKKNVCVREADIRNKKETMKINRRESPLIWLYQHRKQMGKNAIGTAELMAGERLRADMTRAGLLPHMSVDFSQPFVDASLAPESALNEVERIVAARERFSKALKNVGPDFSGILIDFCFFLKGLESIERERGWPARSAKVIVILALRQLSRHYGLKNHLSSEGSAEKTRAWNGKGYESRFSVSRS